MTVFYFFQSWPCWNFVGNFGNGHFGRKYRLYNGHIGKITVILEPDVTVILNKRSFWYLLINSLRLTRKKFSKFFLERDESSLLTEMIRWKGWSVKGIISTVIKIIDDDKNVNETYAALIRLKPLHFICLI